MVTRALLASLLLAGVAGADRLSLGPEISLRVGGGPVYGKADADQANDLSYQSSGAIGVQVDGGLRIAHMFFVGGYLGYGFGLVNHCGGSSCSAQVVRAGGEVAFHALPRRRWDPWVGLGLGYETSEFNETTALGSGSTSASGLELVNVQAGVDARLGRELSAGLYVLATACQYGTESLTIGSTTTSGNVSNRTTHGFVLFGVRLTFLP